MYKIKSMNVRSRLKLVSKRKLKKMRWIKKPKITKEKRLNKNLNRFFFILFCFFFLFASFSVVSRSLGFFSFFFSFPPSWIHKLSNFFLQTSKVAQVFSLVDGIFEQLKWMVLRAGNRFNYFCFLYHLSLVFAGVELLNG